MIAVCVPVSDLLSIVVTAVFVAREVRLSLIHIYSRLRNSEACEGGT